MAGKQLRAWTTAAVMLLMGAPQAGGRADDTSRVVPRGEKISNAFGYEVIVSGRVQHVHAPRLFTVERSNASEPELLVFAPNAEATPLAGTVVTMRGMLRRFADAGVENTVDWSQVDESMREEFTSRPVLVTMLLVTSTGRPLARQAAGSSLAARPSSQESRRSRVPADEWPIPMAPAMLADHVTTLAGHAVRIPNARVVGVFTPQSFLIESDMSLLPLVGKRSRILVFIESRTLRVPPETLVASSVTISGIVRTLLGMQVSKDVPWPSVLTRTLTEHLEIRAALLARSVQTAEGVDLTMASE